MRIGEFAKAVFGHWDSLMSGAIAAGLLWFLTWIWSKRKPPEKLPWYIYAWMIIIFCFVASYQAWVDKDDERERAANEVKEIKTKLENMQPKLTTGFYNAYWIPEYPLLVALVHIGNTGAVQSVAHDFELTIGGNSVRPLTDKQISTGSGLIQIQLGLSSDMIDMVLLGDEFLQPRTMVRPIEQGKLVRGWMLFDLHEVIARCSKPLVATLHLKDINNEKYDLAIAAQNVPPLPALNTFTHFYPDITYPFKRRDIVNRIAKSRGGDNLIIMIDRKCTMS